MINRDQELQEVRDHERLLQNEIQELKQSKQQVVHIYPFYLVIYKAKPNLYCFIKIKNQPEKEKPKLSRRGSLYLVGKKSLTKEKSKESVTELERQKEKEKKREEKEKLKQEKKIEAIKRKKSLRELKEQEHYIRRKEKEEKKKDKQKSKKRDNAGTCSSISSIKMKVQPNIMWRSFWSTSGAACPPWAPYSWGLDYPSAKNWS